MVGPISITDLNNMIVAVQARPHASIDRIVTGVANIQAIIVRVQANILSDNLTINPEKLRSLYDKLLDLYNQAA